jgi:hypothetical protein
MLASMKCFQNMPAYFAAAITYGHKLLMKLTKVADVISFFDAITSLSAYRQSKS